MKIWTSSVLIALMLMPQVSQAQTSTGEWAAVLALRSGDELIVEDRKGVKTQGKLDRVTDTTLTLSHKDGPRNIERSDVLKLYRVSGGSRAKSAGMGALVGAGVGATTGAVAGCRQGCWVHKGPLAAALALVGAAVGTGVGFVVGVVRHKRKLVYQG